MTGAISVVTFLITMLWVAVIIFLISLFFRLVKAVERIADKLDGK